MKKKKGFTLTELIVVIVIIGILAAVLIPTLTGYIDKSKKSVVTQEINHLEKAYDRWYVSSYMLEEYDSIQTAVNAFVEQASEEVKIEKDRLYGYTNNQVLMNNQIHKLASERDYYQIGYVKNSYSVEIYIYLSNGSLTKEKEVSEVKKVNQIKGKDDIESFINNVDVDILSNLVHFDNEGKFASAVLKHNTIIADEFVKAVQTFFSEESYIEKYQKAFEIYDVQDGTVYNLYNRLSVQGMELVKTKLTELDKLQLLTDLESLIDEYKYILDFVNYCDLHQVDYFKPLSKLFVVNQYKESGRDQNETDIKEIMKELVLSYDETLTGNEERVLDVIQKAFNFVGQKNGIEVNTLYVSETGEFIVSDNGVFEVLLESKNSVHQFTFSFKAEGSVGVINLSDDETSFNSNHVFVAHQGQGDTKLNWRTFGTDIQNSVLKLYFGTQFESSIDEVIANVEVIVDGNLVEEASEYLLYTFDNVNLEVIITLLNQNADYRVNVLLHSKLEEIKDETNFAYTKTSFFVQNNAKNIYDEASLRLELADGNSQYETLILQNDIESTELNSLVIPSGKRLYGNNHIYKNFTIEETIEHTYIVVVEGTLDNLQVVGKSFNSLSSHKVYDLLPTNIVQRDRGGKITTSFTNTITDDFYLVGKIVTNPEDQRNSLTGEYSEPYNGKESGYFMSSKQLSVIYVKGNGELVNSYVENGQYGVTLDNNAIVRNTMVKGAGASCIYVYTGNATVDNQINVIIEDVATDSLNSDGVYGFNILVEPKSSVVPGTESSFLGTGYMLKRDYSSYQYTQINILGSTRSYSWLTIDELEKSLVNYLESLKHVSGLNDVKYQTAIEQVDKIMGEILKTAPVKTIDGINYYNVLSFNFNAEYVRASSTFLNDGKTTSSAFKFVHENGVPNQEDATYSYFYSQNMYRFGEGYQLAYPYYSKDIKPIYIQIHSSFLYNYTDLYYTSSQGSFTGIERLG